VHWTGRKFHGYVREALGIEIGYSTVQRWLRERGFRLKVPQPWPDRQDEELRAAFVDRLCTWLGDEEIDPGSFHCFAYSKKEVRGVLSKLSAW